jgi:prepilin-type N-terminal cleavage/methylation domain-containing protein
MKKGGDKMKKGFTLIELLAVIVILAIIALIATPIILGIINDAREESNERSVELYASAVRNGIAAHQLRTGEEVLPGTYNETKPLPFEVDYEGKVECTSVIISESGKVSLEGCTVNGGEKTYNYGIEEETPNDGDIPEVEEPTSTQVYKPQYYSRSGGDIGEVLPSDAKTTVSELNTSYPFYLGLDVDADNKVTAAYSCFVRNNTEYCLKGYDTEAFATNTEVLTEAFGEDNCSFDDDDSSCDAGGLYAGAASDGFVSARGDAVRCDVVSGGRFACAGY